MRNVIGELELDQTLTSRERINTKLREVLDEATDKWGTRVVRVEIQRIEPPKDIVEAMSQQMKAERMKRAAILEAEGYKQSEIKKAEGEKQSEILRAEGLAQARIKTAEAEAEAIKLVTNAISSKNGDPINYLIATKYIDTLQEMVSGKDNKTIYIPFEATGILSSIGGIKEMLNNQK